MGQKETFLELLGRAREIFFKEVIIEMSFSELSHIRKGYSNHRQTTWVSPVLPVTQPGYLVSLCFYISHLPS